MPNIPVKNLPEVDVDNSEQNAFVQNWLTAWSDQWSDPSREGSGPMDSVYGVIEQIQETYNYQDHERRIGR